MVTASVIQLQLSLQVLTILKLEGGCGGCDGHAEQGQNLWSKLYHMQR